MFLQLDFYIDLQKRLHRNKKHPNNIEDIYDGELYKEYSKEAGLLSSSDNISLFHNSLA